MPPIRKIVIFLIVTVCYSCSTSKKPYYNKQVRSWQDYNTTSSNKKIKSLFLIGDSGELHDKSEYKNYVLDALGTHIQQTKGPTDLVYLGDNIYPAGLPPIGDADRVYAEKIIEAHLKLTELVNGTTYFIPGNHDWNRHKSGGLEAILRQEAFVMENGKNVKFFPENGCGGPEVVKINSDLVFVFIDSQWWLQDWSKEEKINQGCDIKTRGDLLQRMKEVFLEHKNDEIMVFLHHPLKSNGLHGGHFSIKHHIFPLHEKGNWIPIPVIGSIYPGFRSIIGSKQDIPHSLNLQLTSGLTDLAKQLRVNVVFVSGHDHGLQYFDANKIKYIVSGGGSKHSYTSRGSDANYAREATGYALINFYENFEAWVEYYTVDGFGQPPVLEYRAMLHAPRAGTVEEKDKFPPLTLTDTTLVGHPKLEAGPIKRVFFGAQYRDVWKTPVKVEAINLETKLGGLTPIKKGGGLASNSLRLEKEDGKQYILRSVKKDYTRLVPPGFANLLFLDLLKDQNSANHPYGALVLPSLSEAADIYYTTPKLVYLKHQRGLANYNSLFSEELYLLEERPNGDWSDAAQFGNSSEIIGYVDLIQKLEEKKRHFVDQKWVCKSRMFDLLIHDWDRHDDQWRWATFKEEDRTVYRPIPRDRDQAFYKFEGLIPRFIGGVALRQFQTMKDDVKDPKFLAFNAKHFDRYFLNELEWSEWAEVISELQKNITDEILEKSLSDLPPETHGINDAELLRKLKSRRDKLLSIGQKLYNFLSVEVEIVGTHNKDYFEVTRNDDGSVKVAAYVLRKEKGNLLKYDRTFYPNETKKIRIYGLRGKDEFVLKGSDNNAIEIGFIGGEDDDKLTNENGNSEISAYDVIGGIELSGSGIIDNTSNNLDVNKFDRKYFKYNSTVTTPRYGSSADRGTFFGFSMTKTKFGWRRDPYLARNKFKFRIAPFGSGSANGALRFNYLGNFPNRIGKNIDLSPEIEIELPIFENWFGLGNESVNQLLFREFNWVRMRTVTLSPLIEFNGSDPENAFIKVGPTYELIDISNTEGSVSEDEILALPDEDLQTNHFLGVLAMLYIGFEDNRISPTNGISFTAELKYLNNLSQNENIFNVDAFTNFYISLSKRPKLVLANIIGYRKVFGDPQFHQYADLGNETNLRGFRDERFRGNSALYHNADLRLHLFNWKNRVLPLGVDVFGGFDYGRVFLDGEDSNTWHYSTTVGLSLNVLGAFLINPSFSFIEEDQGNSFNLYFKYRF